MNKTQDTVVTPSLDLSALSVANLAALLAKAREADKAKKAEASALPMFAFAVVMDDNSVTQWAGRAVDFNAAKDMAIAYAERNGDKAFRYADMVSVTPRPMPGPRGRKAKVQEST